MSRKLSDAERMSNGEAAFLNAWHEFAPTMPEPTYDALMFDDSKHRADFQWRAAKIAVEIDGGNRMARIVSNRQGNPRAVAVGRHTLDADYRKRNKATERGWRVFYYTPTMLADDPIACVNAVVQVARSDSVSGYRYGDA